MMINSTDVVAVLPFILVALGSVGLLIADLLIPAERRHVTAWLAAALLLTAAVIALSLIGSPTFEAFGGMVLSDPTAFFLDTLICTIGLVTILLTLRYNQVRGILRGEFYILLALSISGMTLVTHANNLLILLLGIELLSIPLYVLCGIARPRLESEESALKYFLTGAFASGFLVYGIALTYGASGTLSLQTAPVARNVSGDPLLLIGIGLILVGLSFKVAAVPFHLWAPDAYEGAPTTVTAFMATATKVAGFAALLRVLHGGLPDMESTWQPLVAIIAAATMIVGNLAALAQQNLKRMLAYSSIAHAGYALVGVAAHDTTSVVFYLTGYAFTTLAAFAVITAIGSSEGEEMQLLEAYSGLGRQKPLLGAVLAIAMFSLIGIPPTVGFIGKYFVFQAAVSKGLVWLAVLGVLTSAMAAYYYLRVVMVAFIREGSAAAPLPTPSAPRNLAAAISVAAVFVLGVVPALLLGMIGDGMLSTTP
ncbi:MAG: NADH-quinone oxidoreductase subunit N [Thermoflexales bacterium]